MHNTCNIRTEIIELNELQTTSLKADFEKENIMLITVPVIKSIQYPHTHQNKGENHRNGNDLLLILTLNRSSFNENQLLKDREKCANIDIEYTRNCSSMSKCDACLLNIVQKEI